MKKVYSFLTLLLLFLCGATGARADGGDWTNKYIQTVSDAITTAPTEAGYYLLYNVGRGTYLCESGTSLWLNPISGATVSSSSELPAAFTIQSACGNNVDYMKYVVYVNPVTDGSYTRNGTSYQTFTFQFQSGNYMPTLLRGWAMSSSATAENFTIEPISGSAFGIGGTTEQTYDGIDGSVSLYANGNGGNNYASWGTFTGWTTSLPGASGNGAYLFYPVTLATATTADFTYEFYESSTATTPLFSKVYSLALGGASYPTFAGGDGYTISAYDENTPLPTGTVPANATATTYKAVITYDTTAMGFTPATSVEDATANDKWFAVKMRDSKWLAAPASGTTIPLSATWTAAASSFTNYADVQDNRLWCVTGNPFDGFQIHNKMTGQVLHYTTYSNNSLLSMRAATADSTRFDFLYTGQYNDATAGTKGFAFKAHGTDNCVVNDVNSTLGFWNTSAALTDGGSTFTIQPVSLTNANIPAAPTTGNTAGYVGYFDFAGAAADASLTNEALFNAYKTTVKADTYYKIRVSRTDVTYAEEQLRWLSTEANYHHTDGTMTYNNYNDTNYPRTIHRVAATGAEVPMLFTFEPTTTNGVTTYKIRNANTHKNLSAWVQNGTGIDMPVDEARGGAYTLKPAAGAGTLDEWNLIVGNADGEGSHYINALYGVGTDNTNPIIGDYNNNPATDGGNRWYIIPVSSVSLSVGGTGWASVCYPFAVTLPDGLTAYKVSSQDDVTATLAEVAKAGGVLPAGTPVFVTGNEGSYTMTITTSGTTVSDNLLTGTTVARKGFAEGGIYLLAANSEGNGACLKLNGSTTTTGSDGTETKTVMAEVPANKAYLVASTVNASAFKYFNFGGEVTGLTDASEAAEGAGEAVYYDLQGRRVLYPSHGVFVKGNGRKVYVK